MGQTLQQAELRRSLSKMQGLLGTSAGNCCSKRAPAWCRSSTLGAELKRGWAPCLSTQTPTWNSTGAPLPH